MRNRSIVLIVILLTAAIVLSGIALGQDEQGWRQRNQLNRSKLASVTISLTKVSLKAEAAPTRGSAIFSLNYMVLQRMDHKLAPPILELIRL